MTSSPQTNNNKTSIDETLFADYDWGGRKKEIVEEKIEQVKKSNSSSARFKSNPYKDPKLQEKMEKEKQRLLFRKEMHKPDEIEDSDLSTYDHAFYFLKKRPLISVSLFFLMGSMTALTTTIFIKHNFFPVQFRWANIAFLFKLATVGGIVYYSVVPPTEESFTLVRREQNIADAHKM